MAEGPNSVTNFSCRSPKDVYDQHPAIALSYIPENSRNYDDFYRAKKMLSPRLNHCTYPESTPGPWDLSGVNTSTPAAPVALRDETSRTMRSLSITPGPPQINMSKELRRMSSDFMRSKSLSSRGSISTADTSISEVRCRICYDISKDEDFIMPCKCKGTMGLIHPTCLEQWLRISDKTKCEICGYTFSMDTEPLPFTNFLKTNFKSRHILIDLICFFFLTPAAIVALFYSIDGAKTFFLDAKQGKGGHWKALLICGLAIIVLVLYLIWLYYILRYHYRSWRKFREFNKHLIIKNRRSSSRALSAQYHLERGSFLPSLREVEEGPLETTV